MIHTLTIINLALMAGGLGLSVTGDADAALAPVELADGRDAAEDLPRAPPRDEIREPTSPVRTDGTFYYVRAKHSDKCLHQQGAVFDSSFANFTSSAERARCVGSSARAPVAHRQRARGTTWRGLGGRHREKRRAGFTYEDVDPSTR